MLKHGQGLNFSGINLCSARTILFRNLTEHSKLRICDSSSSSSSSSSSIQDGWNCGTIPNSKAQQHLHEAILKNRWNSTWGSAVLWGMGIVGSMPQLWILSVAILMIFDVGAIEDHVILRILIHFWGGRKLNAPCCNSQFWCLKLGSPTIAVLQVNPEPSISPWKTYVDWSWPNGRMLEHLMCVYDFITHLRYESYVYYLYGVIIRSYPILYNM